MGLGLCKAGHDRYTNSCVVMRQAKGETTRKKFCEESIADTIARADDNTHVIPAIHIHFRQFEWLIKKRIEVD